jgi:short-subunit dehydrogenase
VTGASSGIGRELADLFAADGHELVLVARREERLRETAADLQARHGARAHVVPADLARPDAAERIGDTVNRLGLAIDHLVNNAGFSVYGPFAETDLGAERDVIAVNVTAVTSLAKRFLPAMAARGAGRILNVASTAAFQPGPRMAVYYASKAYVLSFSVALAVEMEGTGVTVTALCPGPSPTGFAERAGVERTPLFKTEWFSTDPGAVARAGYEGMRRGKPIVVPGAIHKAHDLAVRLVPRSLAARFVGRIQAPTA